MTQENLDYLDYMDSRLPYRVLFSKMDDDNNSDNNNDLVW